MRHTFNHTLSFMPHVHSIKYVRNVVLSIGAICFLLSFSGCKKSTYPLCTKDNECAQNAKGEKIQEYCLFGRCQQCAQDSHCTEGEQCQAGRCENACKEDAQCGDGRMCDAQSRRCVEVECRADTSCNKGFRCDKNRCVDMAGKSCESDDACGHDAICREGMCVVLSAAAPTQDLPTRSCERSLRVFFSFNDDTISTDTREALKLFAQCMSLNATWKVRVEGHADDRGTTEFNLQLGQRRADTVRTFLQNLGIESSRLKTLSYGEEKPLEEGISEDAYAKNRRGDLIVE